MSVLVASDELTARSGSRLADWMRLLRLPNLFTVPGDPVAGLFLAGGGTLAAGIGARLAAVVGASLCLYSAGLILNDIMDVVLDRAERPDRPVASGRVSRAAAISAAVGLGAAALGLAALAGMLPLAAAGGVALLVIVYNCWARRVPALGFVVMGLCRGGSLLMGAALAPAIAPVALVAAAAETGYVTALTAAAAGETEGPPSALRRWAPPVVLAAGMTAAAVTCGGGAAGIAAALVALAAVGAVAHSMKPDVPAEAVPPMIGKLVRALIGVQAAFVLMGAGPARTAVCVAAALYATWPLSRWIGTRFRGS